MPNSATLITNRFVVSSYVAVYYNIVVSWALYFLYATFTQLPDLPWSTCDNAWNTQSIY